MLTEALPIYSGGLGNVAGDQLKVASTLGVPIVAVGLLYQQGYFRQVVDGEGGSRRCIRSTIPASSRSGRSASGTANGCDSECRSRARRCGSGRGRWRSAGCGSTCSTPTIPANTPATRCIGSQLYGGDAEQRLQQEMVLGIGGWRLLDTLGLRPEVCHLNEATRRWPFWNAPGRGWSGTVSRSTSP